MTKMASWAPMLFVAPVIIALAIAGNVAAAPAEPGPARQCVPIKVLVAMLHKMPDYGNLRLVPPEKMAEALAFYESLPPGRDAERFTFAMLLDGPKDSGLIIVGRGSAACEFAALPAEVYGALVRNLEGTKL